MLALSTSELRALMDGEVVTAVVQRGTLTEGDEVRLVAEAEHAEPPAGAWTAVVTAVDTAALLDPDVGHALHAPSTVPEGDLAVLRVYEGDRPVLSDNAFRARVRAIEGAMR